ncbi:MAG: cysteine hydrolase family protein, partial [Christensenellales bacterium]
MKKLLAVIDMQNDFVSGALSNSETEKILPAVAEYVKRADEQGVEIVFTRDTHDESYPQTQEGRKL